MDVCIWAHQIEIYYRCRAHKVRYIFSLHKNSVIFICLYINIQLYTVQFPSVFSISNTVRINSKHCFRFRKTWRVVYFTYSCFTTTFTQVQSVEKVELARHAGAKWREILKTKIGARKYKRCLAIFQQKPQRLFTPFVSCRPVS